MKKKIIMNVLTVAVTIAMLSGCAPSKAVISSPEKSQEAGAVNDTVEDKDDSAVVVGEDKGKTPVMGITVNQIDFEVLDPASLSEQMISDIEALKVQKGYEFWQQEDGSFIILISSGEKSTGGYAIEVNSIEDNEGMTVISVTETEPKGDMNAQVISYPYVIVKAFNITDRFIVSDQNQNAFSRIALDATVPAGTEEGGLTDTVLRVDPEYLKPVVGIYQGMIDDYTIDVLVGDVSTPYTAEDIAQYVEGIEKGDKIEITTTVSPSDQIIVESITKVE